MGDQGIEAVRRFAGRCRTSSWRATTCGHPRSTAPSPAASTWPGTSLGGYSGGSGRRTAADAASVGGSVYRPPRRSLVSRTATAVVSSGSGRACARATISPAVSIGRVPPSLRLSSMIAPVDRPCRVVASFRARCAGAPSLIVGRRISSSGSKSPEDCAMTPTHQTDHPGAGALQGDATLADGPKDTGHGCSGSGRYGRADVPVCRGLRTRRARLGGRRARGRTSRSFHSVLDDRSVLSVSNCKIYS